jgi:hypothetical protein
LALFWPNVPTRDCFVVLPQNPFETDFAVTLHNPSTIPSHLAPLKSGETLVMDSSDNTLCIHLDFDILKMRALNHYQSFVKTSCFRKFHVARSLDELRCSSNAEAIHPSQNKTKPPMAIITEMSIHIESQVVPCRGTPSNVVTCI